MEELEELESLLGRSTFALGHRHNDRSRRSVEVVYLYAHLVSSTWWTYSWVAVPSIVDWHGTPAI